MKPKIAIILGSRAELIKTFPVMLELQRRSIPYFFIHTGQHNLRDLCEVFGVQQPDVILTPEPKNGSKFHAKVVKALFWNAEVLVRLRIELNNRPRMKYVLFHGDTMTTSVAAIASWRGMSWLKDFKNVHLEAGLRSNDLKEPFPEEISRKIADKLSKVLLVPTQSAYENVKHCKRKEIHLVGNTISDASRIALQLCTNKTRLNRGRFALVTIHRHENIKDKERLKMIIKAIEHIPIKTYFALHDNTKKKLKEFKLYNRLKKCKNVNLIAPLPYVDFIYQISQCSLLLCDGGSMQEESLLFNKPCIIMRKATERQEGLETNFQFLSEFNLKKTKEKIDEYLSPRFKLKEVKNPYGINVSKKIVDILKC